jgi:hypothetical protein
VQGRRVGIVHVLTPVVMSGTLWRRNSEADLPMMPDAQMSEGDKILLGGNGVIFGNKGQKKRISMLSLK